MRSIIFLISLLLLSTSAFPNSSNKTAEEELHAFNDKFNQLVVQKDMDGFLSLYSNQVLWIAPASPPVEGHSEPRSTFQMLIDNDGELTHTIDKLTVSKDGDHAVMIGEANVVLEKIGVTALGTYLFVLERKDQKWMIMTDMWHQHTKE